MGQYFSLPEVFPLIARIIVERHLVTGDYVSHDEIAAALLNDPDSASILARVETSELDAEPKPIAANMVAWFSQQVTVARNEWAGGFDRIKRGGKYAYRPVTAMDNVFGAEPEAQAIEGDLRLVAHLRRERSRALVEAKKAAVIEATGRLQCEACGFDFREKYPTIGAGFAEIHHNRPLADMLGQTITRLQDLCVLCANCHRMIHRTRPMNSLREFRRHLAPSV
jgi:hypothetical protein